MTAKFIATGLQLVRLARAAARSPAWWAMAVAIMTTLSAAGQPVDKMTPDQLILLMRSQPRLATDEAVAPSAAFDPSVIVPGGQSIYRVSLHTLDEAITRWPEKMPVPPQLQMVRGAEGMFLTVGGGTVRPLTQVNFRVSATEPGVYVMPAFTVDIYGQPVTVPEARLEITTETNRAGALAGLTLKSAETNVYEGQSVRVEVVGPPSPTRGVQMLQQVQLNGDGFISSKEDIRQQISPRRQPNGEEMPVFIYNTTITPFVRGPLKLTAQGFTAASLPNGQIMIRGSVTLAGAPPGYTLLESDPLTLNVQPLPAQGRLPGFMGAVGQFSRDVPLVSSSAVEVGNPVKLSVTIRSGTTLSHLAMPPPTETPAWQAFAAGSPVNAGNSTTFTYTLVPQTDQTAATPAIPFSYFDPDLGKYVDLSIPAMPIKVLPSVTAAGATNVVPPLPPMNAEKKAALSGLALTMGRTASSFVPLQVRGWFWLVELGPVAALAALWLESRRRLYWERHPDLQRRRQARRDLRREWQRARNAAHAGDTRGFATAAVQAIRVAAAPHFPAAPRALVCGDVLPLLPEAERTGEGGRTVRQFFAAADSLAFAEDGTGNPGLLELQPQLDRLLTSLEVLL